MRVVHFLTILLLFYGALIGSLPPQFFFFSFFKLLNLMFYVILVSINYTTA